MSKKFPSESELAKDMTPYSAHIDELASITDAEFGFEQDEKDYEAALKRIESLLDAEPGTPEGGELEELISFVEAYEKQYFPL